MEIVVKGIYTDYGKNLIDWWYGPAGTCYFFI